MMTSGTVTSAPAATKPPKSRTFEYSVLFPHTKYLEFLVVERVRGGNRMKGVHVRMLRFIDDLFTNIRKDRACLQQTNGFRFGDLEPCYLPCKCLFIFVGISNEIRRKGEKGKPRQAHRRCRSWLQSRYKGGKDCAWGFCLWHASRILRSRGLSSRTRYRQHHRPSSSWLSPAPCLLLARIHASNNRGRQRREKWVPLSALVISIGLYYIPLDTWE